MDGWTHEQRMADMDATIATLTHRLALAEALADAVERLRAAHCDYACPYYNTCYIDDGHCKYDDAVDNALKAFGEGEK